MNRILSEHNNRIGVVLGGVRMEFSTRNGAWLSMSDSKGNRLLDGDNGLSAVSLTVGGISTTSTQRDHLWNIRDASPIGPGLRLARYYLSAEPEDTLHLILEEGGWTVDIAYRYNGEHERMERTAKIAWNGREEQLLRWAELRMPVLAREDETTIEMPGYGNFLHWDVKKMPVGRLGVVSDGIDKEACCWRVGLLAAEMPDHLMISWLYGGDMPAFWQLYRGHKGVWFEQKWLCSARLSTGDSISTGTQYFRLDSGGELRDELRFMQDFWDEVGVKLPEGKQTPGWAKKAFIYETHVGPKSFPNSGRVHNPHPTVRALTEDLPRIASLGFDVIELMPRFPFPNYSVEDYFDIETCYGPREDVVELVKRAHELGMKVFVDVVMHGLTDKSLHRDAAKYDRHPLLDRHPEYFIYTEDGRVAKTYTWSFDQSNENFRAYATEAFCYYVRELDVDGFRVDAITWNFFPNWKHDLPHPAYKSIFGCFELFAKIRDAVWAIKPDIAFYSETTGPLMANSYDLSYNYDEVWMYECLLPPLNKELMLARANTNPNGVKVDARGAAEWLDLRQKVMPRGWIKVHHADSHDSHEWGWVGIFQREYIGLAQSRALFAYCNLVEGGVMNYAQGEDGSEDLYRDIIAMRKSFPALLEGSCDYVAILSENRNLFAPLRQADGQTLIPVINFSAEAADSTLDVLAAVKDTNAAYRLTEHFSKKTLKCKGSELAKLPVRLDPYGYQLWQVEKV